MNHKRPVNLALGSLKYPPMAIASILHRISGLVLFLLLPLMLYFLSLSLSSEASFLQMKTLLMGVYCKMFVFAFGAAWIYHLLAGIRHLLMDMGIGESLVAARRGAVLMMLLSSFFIILLGLWLW